MDSTVENSLRLKEGELMRELEEVRAAIRVLGRLSSDKTTPSTVTETVPASVDQRKILGSEGAISLDELDLPPKVRKPNNTLIKDIRNVVERLGDQEFTVNHIVAALEQTGKASNTKHFKNRVSMTMKKLTENESYLERTHKGSGNEPHRYRRAEKNSVGQMPVSLVSNK